VILKGMIQSGFKTVRSKVAIELGMRFRAEDRDG